MHVRVDGHQISMQTHLNAMGAPTTSTTRQLLEARASSTAQRQPDAGAEDEAASDGAGEASPSLSNNAGNNDSDGKRKMSQDGAAPPPRENGEQAASSPGELPGRKARVSVRARSEAPMVISFQVDLLNHSLLDKDKC